MKKFIYENREKIFNWTVLIIYLIITGVVVFNHETYENEAQSFLLVRDLSIPKIIGQLKYEGHSFLWYMVLVPFIKLGLPMAFQSCISWAFGIATVVLILKKVETSKILKLFLIFSSGLLYFHTVIARTYAMIPLLLVLISLVYKKRDQHPYIYAILLALLINTHLIMIPTAVMLAIFYWGKKLVTKNINMKKRDFYLSLLIFIIGLALFGIIIVLSMTSMELVNDNMNIQGISDYNVIYDRISNTIHSTVDFLWGEIGSPSYVALLFGLILLLCLVGIKDDVEQGLVFWAQFLFFILIHSFFWILISERVAVLTYTLMLWVLNSSTSENKVLLTIKNNKALFPTIALILLVSLTTFSTFKMIYDDITSNYSSGKGFAEYINKEIEEGTTILCTFNTQYQPIIGYLPKDKYKFYFVGPQREATFVTWDKNWNEMPTDEKVLKSINKILKNNKKAYILSDYSFVYRSFEGLSVKKLLSVEDVTLLRSKFNFVEVFNLYQIEKT